MDRLINLLIQLVLELIDGLRIGWIQRPTIHLLIGSDLLMDRSELRAQLLRLIAGQFACVLVYGDPSGFERLAYRGLRIRRIGRRRGAAMVVAVNGRTQLVLKLLNGLGIGDRECSAVCLRVGRNLALDGRNLTVELLGLLAGEIACGSAQADAAVERNLARGGAEFHLVGWLAGDLRVVDGA